jgi:hypothetical protein
VPEGVPVMDGLEPPEPPLVPLLEAVGPAPHPAAAAAASKTHMAARRCQAGSARIDVVAPVVTPWLALWRVRKAKSAKTPARITRPSMRWSMGTNFFTFVAAAAVAANIALEKTCTCMFVRGARAKGAALLPAIVVAITVNAAGPVVLTCTAAGTT